MPGLLHSDCSKDSLDVCQFDLTSQASIWPQRVEESDRRRPICCAAAGFQPRSAGVGQERTVVAREKRVDLSEAVLQRRSLDAIFPVPCVVLRKSIFHQLVLRDISSSQRSSTEVNGEIQSCGIVEFEGPVQTFA